MPPKKKNAKAEESCPPVDYLAQEEIGVKVKVYGFFHASLVNVTINKEAKSSKGEYIKWWMKKGNSSIMHFCFV